MTKYLTFSKNSLKRQFAFRSESVFGMFSAVVYIFIQIALWKYVFKDNEQQLNYMVAYSICMNMIFIVLYNDIAIDVALLIQSGEYAVVMIKPMNPLLLMWAKDFGEVVHNLMTRGIIVVLAFILLDVTKYITIVELLWFIFFMILIYVLNSIIYMCIGCIAFISFRVRPYESLAMIIIGLLGGSMLPITFYPNWLLSIVQIMPFKYFFYFPANILINDVSNSEILTGVVTLVTCILLMIVVFNIIYKATVKKVVAQGG